ncbi:hypothetical protein GHV40_11935 [Devosia sp. D6-9]|nr:hypothetical protein GHV40_11935 [Devosia sp. D6-9]
MLEMVRVHIVGPLMGRMGTMAATALAPYVINPDHRIAIGAGITATGLVAFDLVVSYFNRNIYANRKVAETIARELGGDRP